MGKKVDNSKAQYLLVERAFEVLNILKEKTDETKTLTQAEILKMITTTKNARTLSSTIEKMLKALNPPEYYEGNSDKFRIQYKGWDQNIMSKRSDIKEEMEERKTIAKYKKLPSITDLRFVHDFTFDELDSLIEGIYFIKTINDVNKKGLNTRNSKEISRRKPVRDVKGLSESWDASAFMSAHLNMFYDEPQTIRLKIRTDRYTILHDWFGERYEFKGKIDDEYDEVTVVCSPGAMVYWAMQYGDFIEVIGPSNVREKIKNKCQDLGGKYGGSAIDHATK